jgi:hypothetical protein
MQDKKNREHVSGKSTIDDETSEKLSHHSVIHFVRAYGLKP